MSIMLLEIPEVRQIFHNEVWLEGERRHRDVEWRDPEIVNRVCEILLRIGFELRDKALKQLGDSKN